LNLRVDLAVPARAFAALWQLLTKICNVPVTFRTLQKGRWPRTIGDVIRIAFDRDQKHAPDLVGVVVGGSRGGDDRVRLPHQALVSTLWLKDAKIPSDDKKG
jgi:hypothetical protein